MEKNTLTPLRSIRLKCLDCAGSYKGIRECQSKECALFIYKSGKNYRRAGIGGFKTHRKNLSLDGSDNSSMALGDHVALSYLMPLFTTTNPATPQLEGKAKPFITEEMADIMIKAANVIIDTTKTLKPSA